MTKSGVPFLDLPAQQTRIREDLRRRLDAVLDHCQFVLGPEVMELEQELAKFCGASHCVSVSSGTDALQIAMMAEGIGRGDAVFLPAFTYTATAEVPLVLGATPVFVDVDPGTFQIDPAHLARADRQLKSKADCARERLLASICLVNLRTGRPSVRSLQRGFVFIDDLAQSFGAVPEWTDAWQSGRCDRDVVLSVEAFGRVWRWRRAFH